MKLNSPGLAAVLTLFVSFLCATVAKADTGARVYAWAPHLSSPILLNSYGQGIGSYAGRPWGYKIFGVAGVITLGDQVHGAFPDPNDPQRRFRRGWWIGGLGSRIDSYSSVKLQVNWAQYYPKKLEVEGDRPGFSSGPKRIYGPTWSTTQMFGYPEVTLVFHLAGVNDHLYPNRNPNGYFYVVGEYHASPPQPSGELIIERDRVLRGSPALVGYKIDRAGEGTGATPPFNGYDPGGEVVFLAGN